MPGITDLFAAQAPQSQPVINAPTQLNNLQNEQSMNQYRQAMTAASAQDIQMKQRGMQASMLAAGMDRPEILPQLVRTANKLGGVQLDENMTPDQARAFVMSSVPVEQQPQYGLMQQQAKMVEALRNRLAGGAPQGQPNSAMSAGQPSSAGNIDPDTMMLMSAVNPAMATAMTNVQKTQYDSPQGKGQAAYQTKSGDQLAANNAELRILRTAQEQYNAALEPDPELGGKAPADIALGGFSPENRSIYGRQFPGAPFANPEGSLGYQKLESILNPAAAEAAKADFARVTGKEYSTMQTSQGLNAQPGDRRGIIKTQQAQIAKRIADIEQENTRLGQDTGIQPAPSGAASDFATRKTQANQGNPQDAQSVGLLLQQGKITEQQARQLWAKMGLK